jgi:hypothetical protein
MACADEWRGSDFDCLDSAKKLVGSAPRLCVEAWKMEEAVNIRLKHTLAFLIGAIIAAAILRHVGHVYGGFSRQELRMYALIAVPAATLAFYFAQRRGT